MVVASDTWKERRWWRNRRRVSIVEGLEFVNVWETRI